MDWLAGDQSEGVLSPEEFGRVLDRVLDRWEPDGDELDELEQLIDRDEQQARSAAHLGLFSPDGRRAIRAAIQRRRES